MRLQEHANGEANGAERNGSHDAVRRLIEEYGRTARECINRVEYGRPPTFGASPDGALATVPNRRPQQHVVVVPPLDEVADALPEESPIERAGRLQLFLLEPFRALRPKTVREEKDKPKPEDELAALMKAADACAPLGIKVDWLKECIAGTARLIPPAFCMATAQSQRVIVQSPLGKGGFASVFRASIDGRESAIRFTGIDRGDYSQSIEDLETQRLDPINKELKTLLDLDELEGFGRIITGRKYWHYTVMKLHEGVPLPTLGNSIPMRLACEITLQAARRLKEIRDKTSRSHLDVSPSNTLFNARIEGGMLLPETSIIDFATATAPGETAPRSLNPTFAGPEQFSHEPTNTSDVYSLACSLYSMLSGEDVVKLPQGTPGNVRMAENERVKTRNDPLGRGSGVLSEINSLHRYNEEPSEGDQSERRKETRFSPIPQTELENATEAPALYRDGAAAMRKAIVQGLERRAPNRISLDQFIEILEEAYRQLGLHTLPPLPAPEREADETADVYKERVRGILVDRYNFPTKKRA